MATVQQIEQEISKLSPRELAQLREWYSNFDAEAWDRQIQQDAASGKLDALAAAALQDHAAGRSKPL